MFQEQVQFQIQLPFHSREIHERACRRAERYLVAEAELLESIIQIDEDRTFEKFGETHLTPYCVKYLNLSDDVAAIFVRVARKSRAVPELKEAVDEGLSLTKAKAIASVITPENQAEWIEKARDLSKEKLEMEVAAASPSAPKVEKARPVRANTYRVEFDFTEEEMELLRRARKVEGASMKDTFVAALKVLLHKKDPVAKAERSRDRSTPTQSKKPGRKPTTIPAAVLHQVHKRDRGCCQARMPNGAICGSEDWTQTHHLHELANGGEHTLDNLVTLCSSHHRMWHRRGRGEFRVR